MVSEEQSKLARYGFWLLTGLLVMQLLLAAASNMLMWDQSVEMVVDWLGYPEYFLTILGVAQLSAAIVVAVPALLRLKEWAYAGATIVMVSALASHALHGDTLQEFVPAIGVLVITLGSYALRPASRKLGA